jgi:hypothetical protein
MKSWRICWHKQRHGETGSEVLKTKALPMSGDQEQRQHAEAEETDEVPTAEERRQ